MPPNVQATPCSQIGRSIRKFRIVRRQWVKLVHESPRGRYAEAHGGAKFAVSNIVHLAPRSICFLLLGVVPQPLNLFVAVINGPGSKLGYALSQEFVDEVRQTF